MADRSDQQAELESELRALSLRLEVRTAGDVTRAVRHRLETRQAGRRRGIRVPGLLPRQRRWRVAVIAAAALLLLLAATPQGRAAIGHVLRFDRIELRQAPGPVPASATASAPASGPSLPGSRLMTVARARHQVGFPVLVPTSLGQPSKVVVSDGGRVVSLIYGRTPFGQVRLDEFDGHLSQLMFEKFVLMRNVSKVLVNGDKGLWITGPQELLYIRRDGTSAAASAEFTTGNTLIWGTPRVALRMEGGFGKAAAVAIATSAR
jgi:hypothetical protein